MCGKEKVQTSKEFADVANRHCPGIKILYVPKSEIEKSAQPFLKEIDGIAQIPNTKMVHKVTVLGRYHIEIMSNARSDAVTQHYFKIGYETESEEECDENNHDNEREHGGQHENYIANLEAVESDECLCGKWVMVKLSNAKNGKKFMGQVLAERDGVISVKFVKKVPAFDKFVWSEVEEIEDINKEMVVCKLPEPQMDRRGGITFTKELKGHM